MLEKVREFGAKVKGKCMLAVGAVSAAVMSTGVMAFASESSGGGSNLPSIAITQDMLVPMVEGVMANVTAILPVGISLFAMFLGIRILPKMISKFVG